MTSAERPVPTAGTSSEVEAKPRGARPPVDLDAIGIQPIDWPELWDTVPVGEDWCIEPILPRGRQAGLFAPAGAGKSLLSADIAAAKACGRSILGQPSRPTASVVYLDLEMTPEDLRERLADLGYGPDDDLSSLHYYQLPTLPPLDTPEGGDVLMARVVQGEENSADTYRAFYRCTGCRLKAAGVALLRLDHSGKDLTKGQRGSSSKADDLDVIWRLSVVEDRIVLSRTKSRVSYVPAEVAIVRHQEPVLRHELAPLGVPSGTKAVADLLDDLEVALDASSAVASAALTRHGSGRRKTIVLAALRYRKTRGKAADVPTERFPKSGNRPPATPESKAGTAREPAPGDPSAPQVTDSERFREPMGTAEPSSGSRIPPHRGEPDRDQAPEDDEGPWWAEDEETSK